MSSVIEIWKDIPESNGLYQVSNLGRSCMEAGKDINVVSGNEHIKECCIGKRNTCGGYHWQFVGGSLDE